MSSIETFSIFASPFSHNGIAHQVYRKQPKKENQPSPAVLVMHELPGLTKNCLKFAQRLVEQGFTEK